MRTHDMLETKTMLTFSSLFVKSYQQTMRDVHVQPYLRVFKASDIFFKLPTLSVSIMGAFLNMDVILKYGSNFRMCVKF